MFAEREGTPRVKNSKGKSRFTVSADGKGVVSHAGTALLRELARDSGLVAGWTDVLLDTYQGPPVHAPGQVLADLAVSIADGGTALADLRTLRDQDKLFGTVASDATAWRVLDRVSPGKLAEIRTARAGARAAVWAAGGGPDVAAGLRLFFDASLLDAHSEKEDARPTWKKGFGFHPLLCYLDRPEVAGVEALAGLLRPGNAGSNTATDHIAVLNLALAGLPEHARPRPGDTTGPAVLVSADSAGATHAFAKRLRELGCQFSLGFPIEVRVQDAINTVPEKAWTAAYNRDGQPRRGAWVAELTDLLDLSAWPEGSRVIVRRERPHPGAQIRFTDAAGHRFTAFITDTPAGGPSRQLADLEVRHRAHARVEDAIRVGKDTGMANLPCHSATANAAWLELALTGADLLTWTKALCLKETSLARAEPATLRYRLLHVGALVVDKARRGYLKIDRDWPWAADLVTAFARLRAAFT
jgi:hypothetical protein